jgi:hypothetical protein
MTTDTAKAPDVREETAHYALTITLRRGTPMHLTCTYNGFARIMAAIQHEGAYITLEDSMWDNLTALIRTDHIVSAVLGEAIPDKPYDGCDDRRPIIDKVNGVAVKD